MKVERWREVEALLQGALDRPPLERASFLTDACAGNEELKEEAASLIAAYEEAGDFIEQPAIAQDAHVLLGDSTDANIGREIGPYKPIERLGAGGMSEVYLAQDTRLSRPIALKILPAYFASDRDRLRRFKSEARAASALNHPNILTIYEVGEASGVYFIATEFIDGQTIRELIRDDELSLEDILESVEQMTSAVSAAHAAGIVHRDIKPENIMRRADGLVKILDFGIAKLIEPEGGDHLNTTTGLGAYTEAGLVVGTFNYMSPEQARGLPVDERTDIWSLGVVLYEMLAGCRPFSGATRMDTMVAILDREPAPLSQVAREYHLSAPRLQLIIDKCLCKDVAERYRTAGELLVDLKNASESRKEAPANRWLSLPSTRGFSWSITGTVALLIVIAVAATFYRQSLRSKQPGPSAKGAGRASAEKSYLQMSDSERFNFVSEQEHRISTMMTVRPEKLDDDAVRVIKTYVDWYAARIGLPADRSVENWSAAYVRAQPYVPMISRSFAARRVPIIIGIYLPLIESAYRSCVESPQGARGLFQFLPETARRYGIERRDMCDAEKMTPAAAHYIADRMAELGEDSGSLTLVLLSFTRGEEGVRNTLRQLRGKEGYERNFWALFANREARDSTSRNEGEGYVPTFFAAAIVGENPEAFGLQTPPLSTLADPNISK